MRDAHPAGVAEVTIALIHRAKRCWSRSKLESRLPPINRNFNAAYISFQFYISTEDATLRSVLRVCSVSVQPRCPWRQSGPNFRNAGVGLTPRTQSFDLWRYADAVAKS